MGNFEPGIDFTKIWINLRGFIFKRFYFLSKRNLRIGWQLNHTLWKNRAFHQFDYDEGPLAFDSVWAMLRAITEAEQQHPQASSSNDAGNDDNKLAFDFDSVVEEQLATWFNGLSVSFIDDMARCSNTTAGVMNHETTTKRSDPNQYIFIRNLVFNEVKEKWKGRKLDE